MKVLGGIIPPDEGEMYIDGARIQPRNAREALALGCAVASTRYRLGDDWTLSDINNALHGPHYPQAERFARELEALCPFGIAVQPGFEAHADAPTTIGLGDSFVGGFAAALARTPRPGAQ